MADISNVLTLDVSEAFIEAVSPTIDVVNNGDGTVTVTVTDAEGAETFNLGISSIVFNNDYTMTITLPDGTTYTSASLRGATGATGATGNGIASAVLNGNYTLTLTFTDGTTYTTPSIRGLQGQTGNGIANAVLNSNYTLTLNFTDGTAYTTTSIRGATGNGISSIYKTGETGTNPRVDEYTVLYTDGNTDTFNVTNGVKGDTGAIPAFSIGTVTTGAVGSDAAATITGTAAAPVLNLTLPRGATGDTTNIADVFSSSTAYSAGDYVIYNNLLYVFTADHAAGAWTGTDATQVTVGEELTSQKDDYAKKDGNYSEMTVGNADQLNATIYETDKTPYNFRTSGGTTDIGNREYVDSVTGGTIAWNQLCFDKASTTTTVNDITYTYDGTTGKLIVNGTASGTANFRYMAFEGNVIPSGHKILLLASYGVLGSGLVTEFAFTDSNGISLYDQSVEVSKIITLARDSVGAYVQNRVYSGTTLTNLVAYKPMVFDLTQMFGSTIADYINTLETNNAGDGVAFFRSLFPKPYYAYNAGELMSVNASEHVTVGFNLFDEDTVFGNLGLVQQSDGSWYSGNHSNVPSGTVLWENKAQYNGQVCIHYTYKNLNLNGSQGARFAIYYTNGTREVKSADNSTSYVSKTELSIAGREVDFIAWDYGTASNSTWFKDVCINFSWSGYRNGEYEPYESHTYALDNSLTLRGIPKLDGSNNLYYDGDEYAPDGTVTRKYGAYTFTGSETPSSTYTRSNGDTYCVFALSQSVASGINGISSDGTEFTTGAIAYVYSGSYFVLRADGKLSVFVAGATSASDVLSWLTSKSIVYELATPTTETATSYQSTQIVNDFGTEQYVDYAESQNTRDVSVPVGSVTKYPPNLRDKLQHLPNLASADGKYLIEQTNNDMSLETFPIPDAPSTDGTYVLKVVVSSGTPTYSWVSE